MKRIVLLTLLGALVVAGCDLFYDEFTLALNMEPVKSKFGIPPGGSSYALPPTPYDLGEFVDADYAGDITGGGIYDIGVMLSPAHASRTINGKAVLSYGTHSATISYTGSWNDFLTEKTMVKNPTLVSIDNPSEFQALVNDIFNQNPLPVILIEGNGSSSQPITAGDSVTVFLYGQAAASIKLN